MSWVFGVVFALKTRDRAPYPVSSSTPTHASRKETQYKREAHGLAGRTLHQ